MTLCEMLEEDNKEINLALAKNVKTLIERYCNDHAMSLLPDAPAGGGDGTPTKGGNFPLAHSNTLGSKNLGADFSSLHRKYEISSGRGFGSGGGFKKLPSMNFVVQQSDPVEELNEQDSY